MLKIMNDLSGPFKVNGLFNYYELEDQYVELCSYAIKLNLDSIKIIGIVNNTVCVEMIKGKYKIVTNSDGHSEISYNGEISDKNWYYLMYDILYEKFEGDEEIINLFKEEIDSEYMGILGSNFEYNLGDSITIGNYYYTDYVTLENYYTTIDYIIGNLASRLEKIKRYEYIKEIKEELEYDSYIN